MKLITGWKQAYRLYSVQAMAVAGAILAGWAGIPDEMQAGLVASYPFIPKVVQWAALVMLGLGIVARVVDQKPVDPDKTVT